MTREQLKEKMLKGFEEWRIKFDKCQKVLDPGGGECCALCGMSPEHLLRTLDQAVDDSVDAAFEAAIPLRKPVFVEQIEEQVTMDDPRARIGWNKAVSHMRRLKDAFNQEKE